MLACSEFQRFASACSPGDLPPEVHAHLSSCQSCAAVAQIVSTPYAAQPIPSADSARDAAWFSRRGLLKTGLAGLFAGLTMRVRRALGSKPTPGSSIHVSADAPVEFIVVGSGAGGGPLACRLALAGHKVVLCEAGGDNEEFVNSVASVPFFAHGTIESPEIQWAYYVRHYADDERQRRDSKYVAAQDGIYYPRVGALGGCTLHAYLFDVYPSNSDWDHIADLTGDPSWKADNMRKYFQRLERCLYVEPEPGNPSRHGFKGWQTTEMPDPKDFAQDKNALRILRSAFEELGLSVPSVFRKYFRAKLDPNDWRVQENREGIYNTPLFTENGRRRGPRDFIKETAAALPNNLIVKTHTLVTRILFDGTTAIGIEYLEGEHLYSADPNVSPEEAGPRKKMYASREVILSAGTFNSPQILKLSGIGPKEELDKHGIEVLVDLPGVGENLQDRYEVSVLTEMNKDFTYYNTCRPGQVDDPCYAQWLQGEGPYTGIGTPNTILIKSDVASQNGRPDPDLFIINGAAAFKGYYPGYSLDIAKVTNQFVWVVLKGHTLNRAGTVKLRSADPRDTPVINFHYFDEGSDKTLEDLAAMVEGIEFARRMNTRIEDISTGEMIPGPQAKSREDLAEFVRNEAWGHHAASTNKIGPQEDPMAVVDGDFRVHGTRNLRIVDASVFPRIPGYFILAPIYMISEKASDVILKSAE
jgi:choline dehydrogenase